MFLVLQERFWSSQIRTKFKLSLKRKNLFCHPPLGPAALRSIQLMTGKPRPWYNAIQLLGVSGACGCVCRGHMKTRSCLGSGSTFKVLVCSFFGCFNWFPQALARCWDYVLSDELYMTLMARGYFNYDISMTVFSKVWMRNENKDKGVHL